MKYSRILFFFVLALALNGCIAGGGGNLHVPPEKVILGIPTDVFLGVSPKAALVRQARLVYKIEGMKTPISGTVIMTVAKPTEDFQMLAGQIPAVNEPCVITYSFSYDVGDRTYERDGGNLTVK